MAYDMNHARQHPEVAGWAFGALDPGDARAFEEHLRSCDQCQAALAEFQPVARALGQAAPAVAAPDDLEARTVAAVQQAATAASRSEPRQVLARASRRWHSSWNNRLLAVASAAVGAAVTAAAFVGFDISGLNTPAAAATANLRAVPGQTGSALATARHTSGGWMVKLTVENLPKLGSGQFYECWYAGPDNRPGHPQLITAGTFDSSNGTVTMWSAADPAKFPTIQITIEQAGDAGQHARSFSRAGRGSPSPPGAAGPPPRRGGVLHLPATCRPSGLHPRPMAWNAHAKDAGHPRSGFLGCPRVAGPPAALPPRRSWPRTVPVGGPRCALMKRPPDTSTRLRCGTTSSPA
jgi:anti-sigma-K factor RskA